MFEVIYFSRGGNTKKVAETIAKELGVNARNVKGIGKLPPDAFVFLGTGCYGGTLPKDITVFLEKNKFSGRQIALFTTSAFGIESERALIEKQIRSKGAVITANFSCIGHWMTLKRQHPTLKELNDARVFAAMTAVKHTKPAAKREKAAAGAR
jgi:flavodoxin